MKKLYFTFIIAFFAWNCGKNDAISLTFQERFSSERDEINDLVFLDAQRGIAFGGSYWNHAAWLHTRDGGNTWKTDTLQNSRMLQATDLDLDGNMRVVSNISNWYIKRPNDTSFALESQPLGDLMSDIAFLKNENGCVAGGQAQYKGWIWRIENGWKVVQKDTFPHQINAICRSDDQTLHAVGYGVVLKSDNGGKTWKENAIRADDNLKSVHFPTAQTGYAVGNHGTILKTTDGGKNWEKIRNGDAFATSKQPFNYTFFKTAELGYIVGESGLFWKTTDGGENWQTVSNAPSDLNIQRICFFNNLMWIVGNVGRGKGKIYSVTE
ncbi:MAG: hypothetical protein RL757_1144 [Bacteroidota bacterium]|jgi:photosystem II stability/assembly factor-like uncharacterized protein